jgi:protocatechuate 3,4-dioxygenase alpha subunit
LSETTPAQTVGPYLAIGMTWPDGPVADPDGVRVSGRVLDGAGAPVPDALVEAWCPQPRAFARSLTDDDGRWSVTMPEARHYALSVFARGLLHRLVTRVYLRADLDDPVLAAVPEARRATLLAEATGDGYRFDIRLQAHPPERETVFFDV